MIQFMFLMVKGYSFLNSLFANWKQMKPACVTSHTLASGKIFVCEDTHEDNKTLDDCSLKNEERHRSIVLIL